MGGRRILRGGGSGRRRTLPGVATPDPRTVIAGADVVVAGLFSAQRTDHPVVMAEVAAEVTRLGGRVVESFVQRRGVSGGKKGKNTPGGAVTMSEPYSSRTLMSMGKVREIAEACHRANAGAVVFANELTGRQRAALATICGCPVFGHDDLVSPIRSAHDDSPP